MKRGLSPVFLLLVLPLAIMPAGCGGGGSSVPPAVSVSVSAASTTADAGNQITISAQVNNDSSNQGVTWSMRPASGTGSGYLSNPTPTSVTYHAPATPPANNLTVTITGTAVANSSQAASVVITLNAVSVGVTVNNNPVGAGGTALISAQVSGASNQNVTWNISPATGAGSLSNATGTSVTYTAPPAPPASDVTVTITATSAADASKSGQVSITFAAIAVSVTANPNSVEATGTSQLSAQAQYDPSGQGVTWAITPTSGAGTLSNETSTTATYTAPPTPPASDTSVTITATSIADNTKSGNAGITVRAVTVAVAPASGLIPENVAVPIAATVNYDPTNQGAVWTLTQNGTACSPACGTFSPASTLNGTPTTYRAPASVPTPAGMTLIATSVEDGSKSAGAAITVSSGTVELVPYTLAFFPTKVGRGFRVLIITLTNTGTSDLSFTSSSFSITGTHANEFSQTNSCVPKVAAGAACTISVTFKPTTIGFAAATLAITDASSDSPQQVALSGTGERFFAAEAVGLALSSHRTVEAPSPSVAGKVGTRVMELVDANREDPYAGKGSKRDLLVRFWYPASMAQSCKPAEYTPPQVWSYFAKLRKVTLPQVATNSCWEAPISGGLHPVVVFTHGYTGTFTDYTFLFEDLASRGYVVAAVDHTYEATAVEFPDGRMIKSAMGSYLANTEKTDAPSLTFAVEVRLSDLKFVMNQLEGLNAGSNNPFAGKLDMSRVALAGHSLGGLTALLGVQEDPRFRAGVILDGALPDNAAIGTQTPMLVMSMGNEGWGGDDCRLWSSLRGPRLAVNLKGAEHVTPSDAVWLARNAIKTGTMGEEKTIEAVRSYVAAFLDANLRGLPAAPLLKGPSREYPDAVVTTQGQSPCGQP